MSYYLDSVDALLQKVAALETSMRELVAVVDVIVTQSNITEKSPCPLCEVYIQRLGTPKCYVHAREEPNARVQNT